MKMKTIGLIGGMSWESTVTYYQLLNEFMKEHLGGFHSAKCLLYSVDFYELEENMRNGDWNKNAEILSQAAINLQKGGADFILICTNTMHKLINEIQAAVSIPIIHIAEAIADEVEKREIKKVALLGTKYTMEQDFYKERLIRRGFEVMIPDAEGIEVVNNIIFDELCIGIIKEASKREYIRIIDELVERGAEGIILGCTEIGLLVKQSDTDIPLFDATVIHATAAAYAALDM
jgi:aspartate racemase